MSAGGRGRILQRAKEAPTQAEDRAPTPDLERLAGRIPDIIYRYRLRPTRGFEYVSAAALAVTGYTPDEHYADPDLGFKLVHPDDRALLEELMVFGPGSAPIVLRWRRKDGTTIWTEQRNTPVRDEHGELVAIEGVARETADPTRGPSRTVLLYDGLRIDVQDLRVQADGKVVHLTPSEFKLLAYLASRAGEVVSREELMRHLWQSDYVGSAHACETHVSTLRRKIERDPRFPERIVTVRGRGYRFVAAA
jgi:PAS domain S-box-containing protein